MITLSDIQEARERVSKALAVTPLVESPFLSTPKQRVFLKLENMHRTGSFKERGTVNKLVHLPKKGLKGIVAASAGNHAQAVAFQGAHLGIPATIVMPEITPLNKIASTQRWGATIRLEGKTFDEAVEVATAIAHDQNLAFVHAFDDPEIIAGQGTLGLEILDQLRDIGTVVIPIGGGGLCAGTALALKSVNPKIHVVGVQAEAFAHCRDAWRGQAVKKTGTPPSTIADGIAVKGVGKHTLPILKKVVDDIVTVTEEELSNGVFSLIEFGKTVVEGAGAAAVAAWQAGKIKKDPAPVVLVVSGGNIDVNLISRIIEKGLLRSGRLLRLDVVIPDRPGGLQALATVLAELRANILQIHHVRASEGVELSHTGTELILEMRGPKHQDEILAALRRQGYPVTVKS